MSVEKVIELIEKNSEALTKKWLEEVTRNTSTPTYHQFPPKKLFYRGQVIFSELGAWLQKNENQIDQVKGYFISEGRERVTEGFALHEVVSSLILIKKVLWDFAQTSGLVDSVFDLSRLLELNNQIVKFFDRAIYFTIVGYEMGLGEKFQSKGFWAYFFRRGPKPGKEVPSAEARPNL